MSSVYVAGKSDKKPSQAGKRCFIDEPPHKCGVLLFLAFHLSYGLMNS